MAQIAPKDRVLETSTTTGTGTYTLVGAVTGYQAASAVCANNDTAYYYAEDVDTNGVPLGGWETGLGTWATGGTLARTTVHTSSNADAAVSWAAGTRRISLALTATALAQYATLSGMTAATASNTIANGNNTGQVWNWANTTNTTVAMTFGETTAATNGTSTTGVPNQVLLKLGTLASSTASPLSVYSRATHVFSVSPTTAQIFANLGAVGAPTYAFAGATTTGMWASANILNFSASGSKYLTLDAFNDIGVAIRANGGPNGSMLSDILYNTSGICWPATNVLQILDRTDGEWARFTSNVFQPSRGSANATSYAINVRKSRGTVAAPTVITTGDDLLTLSGYGYVGATNTYQIGAKIRFTSSGTVSDAANGFAKSLEIWTGTATVASAASWSIEPDGLMKFFKGTVANGSSVVTPPSALGPVTLSVQEWVTCYNASGTLRYMPLYG